MRSLTGASISHYLEMRGNERIKGEGANETVLKRSEERLLPGQTYSATVVGWSLSGAVLANLQIDANRVELGNVGGHGHVADSSMNTVYSGLSVVNFGSRTDDNGVSGGTGLVLLSGGDRRSSGNRLRDSEFLADKTAGVTIGWLFNDADWNFVNNIYVRDTVRGVGFAHELKTTSSYNFMSGLLTNNANVALALGGEQAGPEGCSFNYASGIIAHDVNIGYLQPKGKGNLISGIIHDGSSAPGESRNASISVGLSFLTGSNSSAQDNAIFGALNSGKVDRAVELGGARNFVQIAACAVGELVNFVSGCAKGVVEIVHPGFRTSIFTGISDRSGRSTRGPDANVVISLGTGERYGSISGFVHDKLEESGAIWNPQHYFRDEAKKYVIRSLGHDGASGNIAGLSVATPEDANRSGLWHVTGEAADGDSWMMRGWGQGEAFRWSREGFMPTRDASDAYGRGKALGATNQRFSWLHAMNASLFPGRSVEPRKNGEMTFELTSNTQLKIRVRGHDGVVRSAKLRLR